MGLDIISERLRLLRKEKGLNQADVAAATNVARGTYASYENGTTPPIDTLLTLSRYYDVSLDYLTGQSHERKHPVGSLDDRFSALGSLMGSSAPRASDVRALVDAAIKYMSGEKLCGELPLIAWRDFMRHLTICLNAATTKNGPQLVDAANAATIAALDVTKMPARLLTSLEVDNHEG